MEYPLCWMFPKLLWICCILLSICVYSIKGEAIDNGKVKKISFFHRHYDSLVTLYHNGQSVNSTLTDEGTHLDNVTVQFVAFGRPFVVDLQLNKRLFSGSYVEKVFHSHGQSAETHHISREKENCYYHGSIRFQPESEAALSTCDGVSGYITDKQDTYHIEPVDGKVHRIYRNRDQRHLPFRCGTEGHDPRLHNHRMVIGRHKRSIRAPYDSNGNTRFVELYLVNDYRTFERHGKNTDIIVKRSQNIANIVSSLYRQLNIYVALVGVEVWSSGDRVSITTSADNTMENFLRYRKERINPIHHNDNAQLITGVFFDHGVVGKAIKGPICTHQFSGGVNMDYGGIVTLVATTVAHEMGHNFGMEHDNDTMCDCRDDKCIMAATSGQISPRRWSSCSQNALAEAFDLGMDYCLRNVPNYISGGPICGNGFKEDGEECDCGLPQDCTNRCCNASSCMLHPQAQCGTGRCCNLDTCKPKGASTLCREPTSECDLSEFCDGKTEYCPPDVYMQDGLPCKGGQSYCYNGKCNTHTDQCKLLWGETGRVSDPICFQQLNMNGNNDGNCGYNWTNDRYKRCDKENVMCGLLHCVHLNEKLMFWRDNLAIDMRASFLSRGNTQYVCRSAMLDVGLDMPDPGFVPDGAKCEENKICINHQCVAIAKLAVKKCPDNCDGHGRCNSNGNCHCDIGYAPPLCDRPGYGGSKDSGPASDEYAAGVTRKGTVVTMATSSLAANPTVPTNSTDNIPGAGANKDLLIALLVVFLLVIPLIVLAIIAFINRRRLAQWWKGMPSFKYRVPGKSRKSKPPPPPPQPNPSSGAARKDPPSYQDSLISNPMLHHNTHTSDVHPKPKTWDSSTPHPAPFAPPERPTAPRRPPALGKTSAEKPNPSKKVRLSIPIQETGGPPSPRSHQKLSDQCVTSMTGKQESAKNIPQSPKANPVVKRESFRGSEISDPVLVCTTNRNSLVLADGNVDIIGPEARNASRSPPLNRPSAVTVKRSQSERPVSRPDPLRPTGAPPPPSGSTLKKSASARSPTRIQASARSPTRIQASAPVSTGNTNPNPSGFRSRPVPPVPTYEEDDTQPIYTNETSDLSDLLSAIDGALKDSANLYSNLSPSGAVHAPIQETAPPAPPRPAAGHRPLSSAANAPGRTSDKPTNSTTGKPISQKPTLDSKKTAFTPKLNTTIKARDSGGRQSPAAKTLLSNAYKPSTGSAAASKPLATPSKPDLASENSLKLQDSVSSELRNKILSRSGTPAADKPANSSESARRMTPHATSNSNSVSQKDSIGSAPATSKPANIKPVAASSNKVALKPGTNSGQSSNKPGASKINSSKTETSGNSSVNASSRPTRTTVKTVGGKPSPASGNVSGTRANASSTAANKTSSTPSSAANSNVSNLAAKFGKSAAATTNSKPSVGKTTAASEEGARKTSVKKVSDTDKPSIPGKPKITATKPEVGDKPVTGTPRPILPPKPGGDPAGPSASTTVSSNAQPKRVQSFRI